MKAVEAVDTCVGRVVDRVLEAGGAVMLTADHGNADQMEEPDGSPFTAHTTFPVPFAVIGMGTDLNLDIAKVTGLSSPELEAITPNDFFVALDCENEEAEAAALKALEEQLNKKEESRSAAYYPPTLTSALKADPKINLALISVPGRHAYDVAKDALDKNINVMLFSDNVSMEEEKKLKEYAVSKELLMMGPDCGTAVVNGLPLAFANVIHKGPIGICGATGTGTQELTILIDQLGSGITQALGTGGRDLKAEIGGLMFKQCLNALIADPDTKVIIMLSKPPADHVAKEILAIAKECNDHIKPVVVDFIGGDPNLPKEYGLTAAYNLEDAARKAVALSKGEPVPADMLDIDMPKAELEALIERETSKMAPTQKYYRGFFSGGTLADESMKLSIGKLGHIYSNIPLKPEDKIENPLTAEYKENTCIDFGEDEFTEGKPHPMIDLTLRCERILRDAHDPTLAILQCDCVIGYGSNANPAEELSAAIAKAKEIAASEGRYISAICSIVGTEGDPQNLTETRKQLEAAGAIVVRSNAQSTYLVHHMLDKLNGGKY